MQRGAVVVNLGRNVWQAENPPAVARVLKAIIHEDLSIDEAVKIHDEMAVK
jgi:putative autoinducer-2 (AI-2) aldolase